MTSIFGEMRRWNFGDTFLQISTKVASGDAHLEIKSGAIFWLPSTGGVWFDTVQSDYIDPRIATASSVLAWATHDQYRTSVREKRISECPDNAPTIQTEPNAPEHLAPLLKMGVRFF